MANVERTPSWRNVAAWGAVGGILYILIVAGSSLIFNDGGLGALFRSGEVVAKLGLGLMLAIAVIGLSSRKQPLTPRTFRNFAILNAGALLLFLLGIWGLTASGGTDVLKAMGASEKVAAITGLVVIVFSVLGTAVTTFAYGGGQLDDADTADELRERVRLYLYSFLWMAACGLLLVLLGLAGPEGIVSRSTALAGALILIVVQIVLGIAAWRLSDELARMLSIEAGNIGFYMVLLIGGGWAALAHLGFVAALAPLDWLTLFTVLLFAASIVATGRRKLLTR